MNNKIVVIQRETNKFYLGLILREDFNRNFSAEYPDACKFKTTKGAIDAANYLSKYDATYHYDVVENYGLINQEIIATSKGVIK